MRIELDGSSMAVFLHQLRVMLLAVVCGATLTASIPAHGQSVAQLKIAPDLLATTATLDTSSIAWGNLVGGQLLVKAIVFADSDDTALTDLRQFILSLGGSVYYRYTSFRALAVLLPASRLPDLAGRTDVLSISPNRAVARAASLLQVTTGASVAPAPSGGKLDGSGVGIAILDSGIGWHSCGRTSAFAHASIGMAIVSRDGTLLQANQTLCTLLGRDEAQLVQRPFGELLHEDDARLLDRHVRTMLERRSDTFTVEIRCHGAGGRHLWVALHGALFDDLASADAGLIFQMHDITSRRRVEELNRIAYHDSLTDLANRMCFEERLTSAVKRARGDRQLGFAVMFLDLDRFKNVNDTLGHAVGDELLKEVARRLHLCVRPRDLVARLGGDEFAILLEDFAHREDVLKLGQRLLQALAAPVRIEDTDLWPLASIGITFSDQGERGPGEVMRDVDAAMYKAKADGRARYAVFDASLRDGAPHAAASEGVAAADRHAEAQR